MRKCWASSSSNARAITIFSASTAPPTGNGRASRRRRRCSQNDLSPTVTFCLPTTAGGRLMAKRLFLPLLACFRGLQAWQNNSANWRNCSARPPEPSAKLPRSSTKPSESSANWPYDSARPSSCSAKLLHRSARPPNDPANWQRQVELDESSARGDQAAMRDTVVV